MVTAPLLHGKTAKRSVRIAVNRVPGRTGLVVCPAGPEARGRERRPFISEHKKHSRVPLGEAVEDYLKAIYQLTLANNPEGSDEKPVATTAIAKELGVSPAAVTKMLRRLSGLRLVNHSRYRGVLLTTAGRNVALEIVRHHRLIELYLTQALGYPLHKVHEEAEVLEHAISEEFEESIDRLLGYPEMDPHGDPIPTRAGTVPKMIGGMLANAEVGEKLVICRVRDQDVEMLRYLVSLGLVPQATLEVTDKLPFGGPVKVRVLGTGAEHFLGHQAACSIFVERQ